LHEAFGGKNRSRCCSLLEGIMRCRKIHWPAWIGGGDLESTPQHQRQTGRLARVPRDLGELPVDVLLIKSWTWTQRHIVAPNFVVVESGRDHQRRSIAASVVEL